MEIQHSCCVTGHRKIPADKLAYVEQELRKEIELAIENGYTHFISGFAEGVDQLFASIVAALKQENPPRKNFALTLEAAIPHRGRIEQIEAATSLLDACDVVTMVCEEYCDGCYRKRNQYMVDRSAMVIAVFSGRDRSGTAATIRYARKWERTVQIIAI